MVSPACDGNDFMECLSGDKHVLSGLNVQLVGDRVRAVHGSVGDRRLRGATWNFSGLGSERKQKEIREVLNKNSRTGILGERGY